MGWGTFHLDDHICVAVYAPGDEFSITAHQASDYKLTCSHSDGAEDEEMTAASLVDVEEDDAGEDDEESVLDTRTDQVDVASKASHFEDIYDVVSHDVSTRHLLPSSAKIVSVVMYSFRGAAYWTLIPAKVRFHMPR